MALKLNPVINWLAYVTPWLSFSIYLTSSTQNCSIAEYSHGDLKHERHETITNILDWPSLELQFQTVSPVSPFLHSPQPLPPPKKNQPLGCLIPEGILYSLPFNIFWINTNWSRHGVGFTNNYTNHHCPWVCDF